jgi:chaperonin GroEL (HSP60 family)
MAARSVASTLRTSLGPKGSLSSCALDSTRSFTRTLSGYPSIAPFSCNYVRNVMHHLRNVNTVVHLGDTLQGNCNRALLAAGMDKILVSGDGDVCVSNDGKKYMKRVLIANCCH